MQATSRSSNTVGVAALVLALGVSACSGTPRSPEMIEFVIKGGAFSVPPEVIRSVRNGESSFVRINDPDTAIELVYDAELQQKNDARGYPLLFGVNEGKVPRIAHLRSPEGALVACRVAAAAPYGGCGSPVQFKGSTWAVLFPEARLSEADAFRRRAEAILRSYST